MISVTTVPRIAAPASKMMALATANRAARDNRDQAARRREGGATHQ
jgi:hypothetical protein